MLIERTGWTERRRGLSIESFYNSLHAKRSRYPGITLYCSRKTRAAYLAHVRGLAGLSPKRHS